MTNKNIKKLIEQISGIEDQTETKVFQARTIPAGRTVGRFISYVEEGLQPQRKVAGKAKEPAENVTLGFELLGAKNIREVEDKEGNKFTVTDKYYVTIKKSLSDRSHFKAIFEKMRREREEIKHMAQMLGEGFVLTFSHKKGNDGKTYANLKPKGGGWMIEPPFGEDPETGKRVTYKVPEATAEIKLFSFANPTLESWNSLALDGKNFVQERILKALNFKGSPLEELLAGEIDTHANTATEEDDEAEVELEDEEEAEEVEEMEVEEEEVVVAKPAKKTTTVAKPVAKTAAVKKANGAVKAVVAKKANTKAAADFAALGLNS